ncbi:MAG: acyltransferase [Methylococcaceae bacterium]
MASSKFDSLQCFRGLAAFGVVIHHSVNVTDVFVQNVPNPLNILFNLGFLGVDFFFVLSGFIILNSHFDDPKTIQSLKIYGIKRFLRIFPPYWPISITMIIAYMLLPNLSQGTRAEFSLLSSFLLLPTSASPALSVAWTLVHEVMFYMIFMIFFISSRLFIISVSTWILVIITTAFFADNISLSPIIAHIIKPINIEFILGMGVACLIRIIHNKYGFLLILFGFIILIALLFNLSVDKLFAEKYRILFSLPFSVLVLGSVLVEQKQILKLPCLLVTLGNASYAIYLIHNPCLSLISRLIGHFHQFASWWLSMLIGVIGSIILGIIYFNFVEKPLIGLFRRFITKRYFIV